MDNIPDTPSEYRAWWERSTTIPYGYCWCGCGTQTRIQPRSHRPTGRVKGTPARLINGHRTETSPDYVRIRQMAKAYRSWWEENADVPYGYCWCGCGYKTSLAKSSHKTHGLVCGEPHRYIIGHAVGKTVSVEHYEVQDRGHDTPCWVWRKSKSVQGYGLIQRNGRARIAHRTYYEDAFGPIPSDYECHHECEVKLCVNPAHLAALPRQEHQRISRRTSLNPEKVRRIRQLAATTDVSYREIGSLYGITRNNVSAVVNRHSWKDVI